ncbi:MAG: ATP-binding cassette domain-containing protein, partial [Bacteroidetes bacterium]|nr:ATP-binding cassette domain-containing protein [Bacteroidota bacterium]
ILGSFLFGGEEVDKQVKVLSGGERNRLALAKLLLQPFNVLVMDEPTNHLDMQSKEVLKRALFRFEGTLLVVSHDRDFLQGLTDNVFEFRDHKIKPYLGDIDYYLEQRKLTDFRAVEKRTEPEKKKSDPSKIAEKQAVTFSYEEQKKKKTLQNRLGSIEKRIAQLEAKIAACDAELLENYDGLVRKEGYMDTYQKLKADLEEQFEQWEAVSQDLEN